MNLLQKTKNLKEVENEMQLFNYFDNRRIDCFFL